MGKRRARRGGGKRGQDAAQNSSDDELIRHELSGDELKDELDEFEDRREKMLLGDSDLPAGKHSIGSRKQEVLAFDDDDDSAEDDEYFDTTAVGDLEDIDEDERPGDDEAGIPSDKAWGKKKGLYYSADYVDEHWKGATREETLELAEMEEREARAIQKRLAQQLEEDDLEYGLTATQKPATEPAASQENERIRLDISKLTRSEKLDLLKKECPELLPLIEELKNRWTELREKIQPVFELVQEGKLARDTPSARYITSKRRLLLVYSMNISFYLSLRSARQPGVSSHPVLRRIAQYGKLLHLCQPADKVMEPEIERVLKVIADGVELAPVHGTKRPATGSDDVSSPLGANKRLRLKRRHTADETGTKTSEVDRKLAKLTMEIEALEKQKERMAAEKAEAAPTFPELRKAGQKKHSALDPFRKKDRPARKPLLPGDDLTSGQEGLTETEGADGDDQKRSITYEMAKNKGLMPKRKRENRNPRVKHKEKFKKALKKRRSMVRLPKKEMQKYGGESFGIRMGAIKSVPIK